MRRESVSMGISEQKGLGNVTPPPSPAEISNEKQSSATVIRAQSIEESTAPTAEHESYDISFHPNESETKVAVQTSSSERSNGKQNLI